MKLIITMLAYIEAYKYSQNNCTVDNVSDFRKVDITYHQTNLFYIVFIPIRNIQYLNPVTSLDF